MSSEWICPNCGARHDDDSSYEECWECEKELCEACAVHTDSGIACEGCE